MMNNTVGAISVCAVLLVSACDRPEVPDVEPAVDPQAEQAQPGADQNEAREPVSGREDQQAAARRDGVLGVADITGNTDRFVGQRVTVQGEVERIYDTRGFKLNDEKPLQGGIDDDLIVVGAKNVRWAMNEEWGNDRVQVTGTIRKRATAVDLERDLGWDFDTEFQEAVEGEPVVLVADDVQRPSEQQQ
jgi:hypothetical protein